MSSRPDWSASVGETSGATPDLSALAPTDYGQTLRLGDAEVSAYAILYEFDADYRREAKVRLWQDDGIGASVRRLRKHRGLNQETVAEAAGLSRRELGRIERGEVQSPHSGTIEQIARALAVAPDELGSF